MTVLPPDNLGQARERRLTAESEAKAERSREQRGRWTQKDQRDRPLAEGLEHTHLPRTGLRGLLHSERDRITHNRADLSNAPQRSHPSHPGLPLNPRGPNPHQEECLPIRCVPRTPTHPQGSE